MAENVDFVNSYIERLNKTVHDLTGRNVVLETRLEVAERSLSQVGAEIEQYQNELAARSKQIDQVHGDNKRLIAENAALKEQLRVATTPAPVDAGQFEPEVIEEDVLTVVEASEEEAEPDDF